MKILRKFLFSVSLLLIAILSIFIFLCSTEPGLYSLIKIANLSLPGKIDVVSPTGRFIDQSNFEQLQYEDQDMILTMKSVRFKWRPFQLLWNTNLMIHQLQARSVRIQLKTPLKTVAKPAETQFSLPNLPFDVTLSKVKFRTVNIEQDAKVQTLTHLHLQALFTQQNWKIQNLQAQYGHFNFSLQGNIEPHLPYPAKAVLQFHSNAPVTPNIQGKIDLTGNLSLYTLQGEMTGPLKANFKGYVKKGLELHLESNWLDAKLPLTKDTFFASKKGQLLVEGNLKNLKVSGNASLQSPFPGNLELNAQLDDKELTAKTKLQTEYGYVFATLFYDEKAFPKFKGEIQTKGLYFPTDLPLRELELHSQFQGDTAKNLQADLRLLAKYRNNLFKGKINYSAEKFKALFEFGANNLNVNGTSPNNWEAHLNLPQPQLLHSSLEGLKTNIQGDAKLSNNEQGKLTVKISPGSYRQKADSEGALLSFQGGTITTILSAKNLDTTGLLNIDNNKNLRLAFNLPNFSLKQPLQPSQMINGKLDLQINSLTFLQGISKEITSPEGRLNASLNFRGTFKKPKIDGILSLTNGRIILPKTNLSLQPIQAKLVSKDKHWKLDGSIAESGKILTLKGDGEFSPVIKGLIKIESTSFPLIKTSEYAIDIAPQLSFQFTPELYDIKGTILVPKAQIKPISFSKTVDLTEDVHFVKDEPSIKTPVNLKADVEIKMGQDVAISIKGMRGFLEGSIHVKQYPQGEPFAVGELSIRDGKYKAYGQKLDIEEGELIFTGGNMDNPGISIRAVRYFNNANDNFSGSNQLFDFNPDNIQTTNFGERTTVGIEVSGRINEPKIKLFSIPANLSQADILSMLILGRPASQANKSGGQLLLTALSSMNLDSGTKGMQLVDQLKQAIGVDFNIADTSQYNQKTNQITDGTAFVVGKSITSRLYLSYNIGLFQEDSNVLTLKYLLNKFFSVQVTTSNSGSGVDLIYTHSKG